MSGNLYIFLDFVAYCYAKDYTEGEFHAELLEEQKQSVLEEVPPISEIDLKALWQKPGIERATNCKTRRTETDVCTETS